MRIYRTQTGWELEGAHGGRIPVPPQASGRLTTREDLYEYLADIEGEAAPHRGAHGLVAPIEEQEVWAAGVTYLRSKKARMEESTSSAFARSERTSRICSFRCRNRMKFRILAGFARAY